MQENEMELDISELLNIIIKRKWLIIFITLISTLAASFVSFFLIEPVYESKVSFILIKEQAKIFYEDRYTQSDVEMFERLIKTYVEIAKSDTVILKTTNSLSKYNKNDIIKSITATPKSGTQILEIHVKTHSPNESLAIANEHAKNFIREANKILPAGQISILDEAQCPYKPVSPNKKFNITIAFFVGLAVSLGIVFLLETLDKTVRTEEQIKQDLNMDVLVVIPR